MGTLFQPDEPDLREPTKNKGGATFQSSPLTLFALRTYRSIRWPMYGADYGTDDPINKILRAKSQSTGLLHVYPIGGNRRSVNHVVKIPINGRQYRVCIGANRFCLARYADVATLYFWKYRATHRQPDDTDFNTSLATATQLLSVPVVRPQLEQLENLLIDSGVILDPAAQAAEDKAHNFKRDVLVARKHLERSRRYVRALREWFALDLPKLDAVARAEASITEILDRDFSGVIQQTTNETKPN